MGTETAVSGNSPEMYLSYNGRQYGLDDKDSGALLAECYKDRMRFSPERNRWYCNDDGTWRADPQGIQAMEFAKEYAATAMLLAMTNTDAGKKAALMEYAEMWKSRPYRERILKEAAGIHPVSMSEFDSNPYLLNLKNGVLDLRRGCFRPRLSGDMCTKTGGAEYHADADCPLFAKLVYELAKGDAECILFIKKTLAYAMTGDRRCNRIFIFEAAGGDCRGRDIFLEVIAALMGDYFCQVKLTRQMEENLLDGCGYYKSISQLAGARFVDILGADKSVELSSALVTGLTRTGSLTVQYPGLNDVTVPVCFKAFISSPLTVYGSAGGLNPDKVNVIPISGISGDYAKLRAELLKPESLSGILNWILRGFSSLWADGLNPPEAVVKATEQLIRKPAA